MQLHQHLMYNVAYLVTISDNFVTTATQVGKFLEGVQSFEGESEPLPVYVPGLNF